MEDMEYQGKPGGGLAVLSCGNDSLEKINSLGTKGKLPCHILLDEKHHYAFVSNYMSGSLAMFSLREDGRLDRLCDLKQHEGKGTHPTRQEGPHVHFAGLDPHSEGLWCVDLGQDKVIYYQIDTQTESLRHCPQKDLAFPGGCGPRHFVIPKAAPDRMYVVCELSSEVFVIDLKGEKPEILQRISTLEETNPGSTCAAIKCSEDGRFLYASNRGDDSIAVYEVEEHTGLLHRIQIQKTGGKSPRDFLILEDLLLAANQDSDTITCFFRDENTGKLSPEGESIRCHAPVCLIAQNIH
jgi:6-phosphogluconolactonase